MSYKSNPWVDIDENLVISNDYVDPDIEEQALFIFSGKLHFLPSED